MENRITRSRSRTLQPISTTPKQETEPDSVPSTLVPRSKHHRLQFTYLDGPALLKTLKTLPRCESRLIQQKRQRLQDPDAQVPALIKACDASSSTADQLRSQAAAATLVFAQESAGTAVCISPTGLLLTCAHCIAESEAEFEPDQEVWLLFASGCPVRAKCIAWDPRRDLALLHITKSPSPRPFPHVRISQASPNPKVQLLCIGHPGSEDLETEQIGVATNYDVLHISEGRFRGLAKGQDVQDNSEIGALMHDCWTYWGHSGAPIIEKATGKLIGLHSSWDDETTMRRGVAGPAIRSFLHEHCETDGSQA